MQLPNTVEDGNNVVECLANLLISNNQAFEGKKIRSTSLNKYQLKKGMSFPKS